MNRSAILLAAGIFCAGTQGLTTQTPPAAAQTSPAVPVQSSTPSLPVGAPIAAALIKPLDSRKAKPGDAITARVEQNTEDNGRVIVPEGARLEGRVTGASARSKGGAQSSLALVFDKLVLKQGVTVPVNVTVQAMALPQSAAAVTTNPDMGTNTMPGVPSSSAARVGTALPMQTNPTADGYSPVPDSAPITGAPGAVGGLNSQGLLNTNSKGVFGLPGISLAGGTGEPGQSAMISTSGKGVHLDGGTQLLLITQAAAAQPPSHQ